MFVLLDYYNGYCKFQFIELIHIHDSISKSVAAGDINQPNIGGVCVGKEE